MHKKLDVPRLSVGEFFDKLTINIRKAQFGPKEYEKRVLEFLNVLDKNSFNGQFIRLICELQMINTDIWNLESEIRRGNEGNLGLVEIGRRSLIIRDYNTKRINRINELNRMFGQDEQCVKKFEHLSQNKE